MESQRPTGQVLDREDVPEPSNPLGVAGIEFVEFATSKPQALGGVLEMMGFRPIARHRSREVELYRQGSMNIIVNAQPTGFDDLADVRFTDSISEILPQMCCA